MPIAAPPLLSSRVEDALDACAPDALEACIGMPTAGEHDELLTTLALHDLWFAPVDRLGDRAELQAHPATATLLHGLEGAYLARVRRRACGVRGDLPDGVDGMRRVAALDRVPAVYHWLREDATWEQLVEFLAVEGGPDAGFDDLVALCQVGLAGDPKVALAENYWDEMGRGDPAKVHTVLHDRLVAAVRMRRIPRRELSTAALDRMTLNGVLARRRVLQPELLGALCLLEVQAGPRCRAVVGAMQRLDAPGGALLFYAEHASADPRHGKEWLERVVAPLARDPALARRIVDGATWRHVVNMRFFASWSPS